MPQPDSVIKSSFVYTETTCHRGQQMKCFMSACSIIVPVDTSLIDSDKLTSRLIQVRREDVNRERPYLV